MVALRPLGCTEDRLVGSLDVQAGFGSSHWLVIGSKILNVRHPWTLADQFLSLDCRCLTETS